MRKVRKVKGSLHITIEPGLARDRGFAEGVLCEWRSLPVRGQDFQKLKAAHPDALVLVPIREEE